MIDLIAAFIIDLVIGDPVFLPHPIRLMGKIITLEERTVRKFSKTEGHLLFGGALIVFVNIFLSLAVPYMCLRLLRPYKAAYHTVNIYFLYTCIAARCLHNEGIKIYRALNNGIEDARIKLSYIVGRETSSLNESEIVRATVETIAENTSDGVIAPIIYSMIGGAPLAICYKMINTMDSMLGYMSSKYKSIGCFPAKTDDVFNFIPARITGMLMNVSGVGKFNIKDGFRIMFRDRKNHKSPNCGYPEAAVAGLLGVQLGGDNVYFGQVVEKPKIGDSTRQLIKNDIKSAIEVMYRTEIMLMMLYILIYGVIV